MPDPTTPPPATSGSSEPVPDLYRALHDASRRALEDLVASEDSKRRLIDVHALVLDFQPWLSVLEERPELDPLRTAVRELHAAVLMASQALYRPAYMALRLFLELSLGTLFFSALDFELRRWAAGERDVVWRDVSDKGHGVLSAAFARAYAPLLEGTQEDFRELAVTTYRTCSQFVHGNPGPTSLLPEDIALSEPTFSQFCDTAHSAIHVVLYTLVVRHFGSLAPSHVETVKPAILDHFGDVPAVRSFVAPVPE